MKTEPQLLCQTRGIKSIGTNSDDDNKSDDDDHNHGHDTVKLYCANCVRI